jgi:co-chaperonin GroES (HSP10)
MLNFTPLGDFILVKPDPEQDKFGSIWNPKGFQPQGHQAGDYRKLFTGTVVAVGPGDKLLTWGCGPCSRVRRTTRKGAPRCPDCAQPMSQLGHNQHPMHVKPGDRVIYPRRPNSPVGTDESTGESYLEIDGEKYQLFHEEQSCLAIIEA